MTKKRNSSKPTQAKAQIRLLRLQRNRQLAKNSRLRFKSRIRDLETQIQRLSTEALRLKFQVEMNECLANQGPLTLTGIEILADVREIVGNKDVTDAEIAAFLQKTKEKVEPIRQEEMRQAFQRTILTTIPSSLLCCMAVNAAEAQTQTQTLLQSSVGAQASAAFRLFQSYYQAHSEEIG
jgi:hypothetical protein